jgi:hypothetical protein
MIIKISSPVQRICRRCYIDSTKLIYDAFTAETGFIKFKGWCPFKFENKHQRLNGHQRAID